LTVGSVTDPRPAGATTNGITTGGNDLYLQTGGLLTIAQNIAVGAGTVELNSAAGATETTGAMTGTNLLLVGTGVYDLQNASNNFVMIAANVTGDVSYIDADDITVGTVSDPRPGGLPTVGVTVASDFYLESLAGSIYLAELTQASGSVQMFAYNSILDRNNEAGDPSDISGFDPASLTTWDIIAGNDSVLVAYNGTVGAALNPIEVQITGALDVYGGGVDPVTGLISVNLVGTLTEPPAPFNIPGAYNGWVPPGLMLWNWRVVGGVPIYMWNTAISQDNIYLTTEPDFFNEVLLKVLLDNWFKPAPAPYKIDDKLRKKIDGLVILK
jgi:hypothetical protein